MPQAAKVRPSVIEIGDERFGCLGLRQSLRARPAGSGCRLSGQQLLAWRKVDVMYVSTWRPMTLEDLEGVLALADVAFPDHFEEPVRFEERLRLSPSTCFTLIASHGDIEGYLIAYPWTHGSAPPLNGPIGEIPENADVLYIHDLALLPVARGKGVTRAILDHLVEAVPLAGWRGLALVAVNQSVPFWERNGFEVIEVPSMGAKLASYGDDARYMVRGIKR